MDPAAIPHVLHGVEGYMYPNEIELQWSVLIVLYPFITGLVAGAFILASLARVFRVEAVQPAYRLALLTALAFLLVAPLPLQLHLGHPERSYEMYLTPHTSSAMAMFGFVYLWYLMAVLVLGSELRADRQVGTNALGQHSSGSVEGRGEGIDGVGGVGFGTGERDELAAVVPRMTALPRVAEERHRVGGADQHHERRVGERLLSLFGEVRDAGEGGYAGTALGPTAHPLGHHLAAGRGRETWPGPGSRPHHPRGGEAEKTPPTPLAPRGGEGHDGVR
jgi:hypothetical protein